MPNPIDEITKVVADDGTFILNVPSVPVCVAMLVPFTETVALAKALPSFESVTFPVTILSCANAGKQIISGSVNNTSSRLKFIIDSLLVKKVKNVYRIS